VSWHFLVGLEAEFSEANSSDGEPCAPLKSTPSVGRCSSDARWMDAYRGFLSGTTSAPLTVDRGEGVSTSSQGDSHVKTSVQRVPVTELPAKVQNFGSKCRALLARFGLSLRSQKTIRTYVPRDLAPSSLSLPKWGMSADGGFWELGTSVPPINSETVFGFLLPTLTASEYGSNQGGGAGRIGEKRPSLRYLLPTLRVTDSEKSGHPTAASKKHGDLRLGGPLNPTWSEWFMGFPLGWTALEPLEMRKYRQWQRSHGRY
jgi:hypothetical protein